MSKLVFIVIALFSASSMASWPDPELNEIKVEEVDGNNHRICVRVHLFADSGWKCSTPYTKDDERVGKLFLLHRQEGTHLRFDIFSLDNFSLDQLFASVQSAYPEKFPSDEPCKADSSQLAQVVKTGDDGVKYFERQLRFENFVFPGSTKVNEVVALPYLESSDGKSQYGLLANWVKEGTQGQQISITATAPAHIIEGVYVPDNLSIRISDGTTGETVKSYSCIVSIKGNEIEAGEDPTTTLSDN